MLLEKDENFRLGTNDPEDIKNHPFFSGVDWNEAANQMLTPPFLPSLKSPEDTKMFDTFYLNQPIHGESFVATSSSTNSVHFPAFEFNRSADKATSGNLHSKPLSYKSNSSASSIRQHIHSTESSQKITELNDSNKSDTRLNLNKSIIE